MSANPTRVNPGDRITAEFMNNVLDRIDALQAQIDALKIAKTSPIITGTYPAGSVRAGDDLQVLGANFLVPAETNRVTLDGIPIAVFSPFSTDSKVIFNVPAIAGAPRQASISITTTTGTATSSIFVLPPVAVPHGRVVISAPTVSPAGAITVGTQYTIGFTLDAQTTIAETYKLAVKFTDAVGATADAWAATAVLLDSNAPLAAPYAVTLKPSPEAPRSVAVKVTVPTGAQKVNLSLRVVSTNNDAELTTSSAPMPLQVNANPETNDIRIKFIPLTAGDFVPPNKATLIDADEQGNPSPGGIKTVAVPYGTPSLGAVPLTVHLDAPGHYQYDATIEDSNGPNTGPWSVTNFTPNSPGMSGNQNDNIKIQLTLQLASGQAGHPERRILKVKASRTDSDAIGKFESVFRIPIVGK